MRIMVCLLIFVFSPLVCAVSYTLELTEAELQQRVSASMPLSKKQFFTELTLFEPRVDLIADSNQIGVFSKIHFKLNKQLQFQGQIKIRGQLTYRADEGAFYFKAPIIEALSIEQLPQKYQAKAISIAQKSATYLLNSMPVYRLKADQLSHNVAKATLKSVTVKDEKLLLELALF